MPLAATDHQLLPPLTHACSLLATGVPVMKSRPFDRLFDGESVKADRKPVRLTQPSHPSFPSVGFCTFDERRPSVRDSDCQDAWPLERRDTLKSGSASLPMMFASARQRWFRGVGCSVRARSCLTAVVGYCLLASVSVCVSVRCFPAAKLSEEVVESARRCCGWACACCFPSPIWRW